MLLHGQFEKLDFLFEHVLDAGQKRLLPTAYILLARRIYSMSTGNGNDQANRAISTGKLHALPHFHTRPINVVVFHGSDREHSFPGWFPA